jgi:hypothetical protein
MAINVANIPRYSAQLSCAYFFTGRDMMMQGATMDANMALYLSMPRETGHVSRQSQTSKPYWVPDVSRGSVGCTGIGRDIVYCSAKRPPVPCASSILGSVLIG